MANFNMGLLSPQGNALLWSQFVMAWVQRISIFRSSDCRLIPCHLYTVTYPHAVMCNKSHFLDEWMSNVMDTIITSHISGQGYRIRAVVLCLWTLSRLNYLTYGLKNATWRWQWAHLVIRTVWRHVTSYIIIWHYDVVRVWNGVLQMSWYDVIQWIWVLEIFVIQAEQMDRGVIQFVPFLNFVETRNKKKLYDLSVITTNGAYRDICLANSSSLSSG